jgi:hypothetical protein
MRSDWGEQLVDGGRARASWPWLDSDPPKIARKLTSAPRQGNTDGQKKAIVADVQAINLMTRRSNLDRPDAIHSLSRSADRDTNRREAADFDVPSPAIEARHLRAPHRAPDVDQHQIHRPATKCSSANRSHRLIKCDVVERPAPTASEC